MKAAIKSRKRSLAFLIVATIVVVPAIVWSSPSNPPLGKTGAPGETTCASCHNGGSGGGSITVTSSAGKTYHPGTKQHLIVTITDAHALAWGYEMTAVTASKPSVGAGVFKATDNNSAVRSSGTKSYAAQINDHAGASKKVTYKVDWTPPSKAVGNITLYFSGVGDVDSNPPNSSSVYASKLTLTAK